MEVGSGQGIFLKRVCGQYLCNGIGADISSGSVDYANKYYSKSNLKFIKSKAEKLPFEDNSFDFVTSFDTLEHIENQVLAVSEMIRVLKKGGRMLIYTLNKKDKYKHDWIWEKLGFDIYSRAAHKRSLFVDSRKLAESLEKSSVKVETLDLYGGIFTLGIDEIIMVKILIAKKLGLFKSEKIGNSALISFSFFSKLSFNFLSLLDQLWYKNGHSLGFAIIAKKST